jgi:tetratricopeptide (TPR) repeat protein
MRALGKNVLLSLGLTAMLAASAPGQAKPKQCEIDEGNPGQLARATLALQVAASSNKPADAAKQLQSAMKLLTDNPDKKNPVGRSFLLGKTLVTWMAQPDVPSIAKRGTLGYATNPDATIDIVAAIDSAFTVVETSMPECSSQTSAWRAQKGWVTLVNSAIEQVNQEHTDTAEALAKRSLVLYHGAPYGYMVLGNVAQKRGQTAQAIQYYKQTIEAAKDTTYADVRRSTLLNLGNMAAVAAETATGDEKTTLAQTAKDAFEQLLKDPGKGNSADQARLGLTRLALARGDTASFKATYQDQLANPDRFDYQTLMNSAVSAARADQVADAAKLFEAALQKNPYHRDALYNLAIMDIRSDKYEQALPLIRRLVAVDPSNGDNYKLFAFAYAGMQKYYSAQGKKTKVPAQVKFWTDSARMATDSALKYNDLPDKMPVKVTFTEFTPGDDKAILGGRIANNGDAPKPYSITIEFLDRDGKVVATQEANVAAVAPKSEGRFSVTAVGPGIVAFRYKEVKG